MYRYVEAWYTKKYEFQTLSIHSLLEVQIALYCELDLHA